jgi:hypothetical protein
VFPLPVPLKVAVFPVPGTELPSQFPEVAHVPSIAPVHVSLAARALGSNVAKANAATRSVDLRFIQTKDGVLREEIFIGKGSLSFSGKKT